MSDVHSDTEVRRQLDRWVAEGLIEAAQAARIETAEAALATRPPAASPSPPAGRRAPLVAEALGYAGGAVAIAAALFLIRRLWPGIPTWAELAFAAVACVALGVAGAAVHGARDPALGRLRSVLWLMSMMSLSAFIGLLAYHLGALSPVGTALVIAAAETAYGAALWLGTRAALQHLAVFASVAVLIGLAVGQLGPGLGVWAPGLGIWVLSALWGAAVIRGYFPPPATGYFAAAAGLVIGAELTMQVPAGHVLALATVAGLLAAGVWLRRVALVVVGAVGVLLVVPQTAVQYLPVSVAAPVATFVAGLVLLGSAIWLARRRADSKKAVHLESRHGEPVRPEPR